MSLARWVALVYLAYDTQTVPADRDILLGAR